MFEPLIPKPSRRSAPQGHLRSTGRTLSSALAGVLFTSVVFGVSSPARADTGPSAVTRMVVRFQADSIPDLNGTRATALSAKQVQQAAEALRQRLSSRAGRPLSAVRQMADGAVIYETGEALTLTQARAMAVRLSQDASVLDVDPDLQVTSHESVDYNDPYFSQQWALQRPSAGTNWVGGASLSAAHTYSRGAGVVVAVLDTGHVAHGDLTTNILPGYDMVTGSSGIGTADGNDRDSDPTDPGDACTSGSNSSWHGLKVSGVVAASRNNAIGVSGAAPGVSLLPVRVMGKCGGNLSDVADGIRWAVGGLSPTNPNPARVINLSLGVTGYSCPSYLQSAINVARAAGAVVVASAGNDAKGELATPANCAGVISVGAHTPSGDLATYSNRSSALSLTAPAGGSCMRQDSGTCLTTPILTLTSGGLEAYFSGTSAAAPNVTSAAALMLAAHPSLTPDQVQSGLLSHARAHPSSSWCAANVGQCGFGMLDAEASVLAVLTEPQITIAGAPSGTIGSGRMVTAVATVAGLAPYTYQWTQTSGTPVALNGASSSTLSFVSPSSRSDLSFALTVTDAANRVSSAVVAVKVNNAPALSSQTYTQTGQAAFHADLGGVEPDGEALTYVLVRGPNSAYISGNTLFWPAPERGTTTFQIQALDPQGLGSSVSTFTLVVDGITTPSSSEASMLLAGSSTSSAESANSSSNSSASSGGGGGGGGLTAWPLVCMGLALLALHLAQRRPRARPVRVRQADERH